MSQSYLITGGAGFIGSHILEKISSNDEITILDNFSSGSAANLSVGSATDITIITGSITDYPLVKRACENVDGIFHLAAAISVQDSVKNPRLYHETNATGTYNILEAARETGVSSIVFSSSSAIYGEQEQMPIREEVSLHPLSPYAATKIIGETYGGTYHSLYGIGFAALRYFNVFGPRQDANSYYAAVIPKFVSACIQNRSITIFGDGNQTRDFISVRDIASANIHAMQKRLSGVFNVGSGTAISINNLAKMIPAIMQKDTPIIHEAPRAGDIIHSVGEISAIRRTGWTPSVPLDAALTEYIDWYNKTSA
jgi:UDP-glucose 4-epimerase